MATKYLKTVQLNDGTSIPSIGLGTWKAKDEEVYDIVKHALSIGYRHIDTAAGYGNEVPIGKAIKDSGIPREEIYVTTKLWITRHAEPVVALKESLERLDLEYVDLFLMHWPVYLNPKGTPEKIPLLPNGKRDIVLDWSFVKTFELMQECVEKGLTKSIGVSNFSIKNLKKILAEDFKHKPVINQVEIHPYLPNLDLNKFCQQNGIYLEAYSPLGSDGSPLLSEEVIIKIGEKYNVPPATIIFSWLIKRGIIALPKSIKPHRVEQNLMILDLADEDVQSINDIHLTKSKRYGLPDWDPIDVFGEDE
ncbi:glycerol 2-dehydrogenase (NADP(+)) [[Candida] jaroonii]|uniref:Glycerol 2-dehydrogenase (NADP(+)) n=1 Tax=[Candida] jaroonii TaxID=467808 RepID=A0ACA9Y2Z1_9ASCO|nr:glycerol 2-dehydrogenase (NADP(+)) [[Candida] jaroonii]